MQRAHPSKSVSFLEMGRGRNVSGIFITKVCKKSVLERKQIDNKAEKGYLKVCLDGQRERFEIFPRQPPWGVLCQETWTRATWPLSTYCLRDRCPELSQTPQKMTMPLLSPFKNANDLLSRASANISVADPRNPWLFVCPSVLAGT